jgi:hypothetical protein
MVDPHSFVNLPGSPQSRYVKVILLIIFPL